MAKCFEERVNCWWVDYTCYSPQTLFTFFEVDYDLYNLQQHGSVAVVKKKLNSDHYKVRISCPKSGITARFTGLGPSLRYDAHTNYYKIDVNKAITMVCIRDNFAGLHQMSPHEVLTSIDTNMLLNEVIRRNAKELEGVKLPKLEPAKILQFKKMVA